MRNLLAMYFLHVYYSVISECIWRRNVDVIRNLIYISANFMPQIFLMYSIRNVEDTHWMSSVTNYLNTYKSYIKYISHVVSEVIWNTLQNTF